jgi:hypothetical protein
MALTKQQIYTLLFILALLFALPAIIFLARQRQEIRPKALAGKANFLLSADKTSVNKGETFTALVSIALTDPNIRVSGVDFLLLYPKNMLRVTNVSAEAQKTTGAKFTDVVYYSVNQSFNEEQNYMRLSQVAKKPNDQLATGNAITLASVTFEALGEGSANVRFPDDNNFLEVVGVRVAAPTATATPRTPTNTPRPPTNPPAQPTRTPTPRPPSPTGPTPTGATGTPTVTPTQAASTPTPTCNAIQLTPPASGSLSATCGSPTYNIERLAWIGDPRSVKYHVEIHDKTAHPGSASCGLSGNRCIDTTNTWYDFDYSPGHIYGWIIFAVNACGTRYPASGLVGTDFSCGSLPTSTPTVTPVPTTPACQWSCPGGECAMCKKTSCTGSSCSYALCGQTNVQIGGNPLWIWCRTPNKAPPSTEAFDSCVLDSPFNCGGYSGPPGSTWGWMGY